MKKERLCASSDESKWIINIFIITSILKKIRITVTCDYLLAKSRVCVSSMRYNYVSVPQTLQWLDEIDGRGGSSLDCAEGSLADTCAFVRVKSFSIPERVISKSK